MLRQQMRGPRCLGIELSYFDAQERINGQFPDELNICNFIFLTIFDHFLLKRNVQKLRKRN